MRCWSPRITPICGSTLRICSNCSYAVTVAVVEVNDAFTELLGYPAGHLPALLADPDGTVRKLDHALSPALAVTADRDRPEATAKPGGSTLLLYTDGLVERRLEVIDAGIQRASDALAESRHLPPEQVADHLSARLLGAKHTDDVALLVYRQPRGPDSGEPS